MAVISSEFQPFVEQLAETAGITLPKLRLSEAALHVLRQRLPIKAKDRTALASPVHKRYIAAPLLHQQSSAPSVQQSLRALHDQVQRSIIRSKHENGAKVLSLSPMEASVLREKFPNLLIEEDRQYSLARRRSPIVGEIDQINTTASTTTTFRVRVKSEGGQPVGDAEVILLTNAAQKRGYVARTTAQGTVTISIRNSDRKFEKVMILPKSNYWSRVVADVRVAQSPLDVKLSLNAIPAAAGGYDWGPTATEASRAFSGDGIKIAVIDTGIARHPHLRLAGGHNFIAGEDATAWDNDQEGHGTHCAGVVAALLDQGTTWGYAPKASLYSLRVFGGTDGGGYSSDIGDAIDWAIDNDCDVISMSLGSAEASSYIRMRIERAIDHGILCVAAAGNEGGDVAYPARFRGVVGVSAIGKKGAYPTDSIHADAESSVRSADGNYYFASFSNRGPEVDICAPGVAVTSTVPSDSYNALDGTSMACPQVAGVAALVLQASDSVRSMPKDAGRMAALFDKLQAICADLGMGSIYQGCGLPKLSRLQPPSA